MVVANKYLGTARVSVTEEPDAGKPHVRICMGGLLVRGVPTMSA